MQAMHARMDSLGITHKPKLSPRQLRVPSQTLVPPAQMRHIRSALGEQADVLAQAQDSLTQLEKLR